MNTSINKNNTQYWKQDVIQSVDFYNDWFIRFAPKTYRDVRNEAIVKVEESFDITNNLVDITPQIVKENPSIISMLRMATAPPIAVDRLIGLSDVPSSLVKNLENNRLPVRMVSTELEFYIERIISVINRLLDKDIFEWIEKNEVPNEIERRRSASIVADRLCGSLADPIIRNEQEKRQLKSIQLYLEDLGYRYLDNKEIDTFKNIPNGTFAYHINVPVEIGMEKPVNIPVDVALKRKNAAEEELPLFIECKSAGDYTNTNKRRKEEAQKIIQLKNTYGNDVEFILFLCGYFDTSYLGYEAAEGIDWIWEHRINDLLLLGL